MNYPITEAGALEQTVGNMLTPHTSLKEGRVRIGEVDWIDG